MPLVAAVISAAALTGAAFYTVEQATCGDPAQYIRHDDHVELIGGCVRGSELPQVNAPNQDFGASLPAEAHHNYRP